MAGITSDFMRQALQQALADPAAAGAGVTSQAGATAQPQQPAPDAEVEQASSGRIGGSSAGVLHVRMLNVL